jgi:flagellar assembly protein FliH
MSSSPEPRALALVPRSPRSRVIKGSAGAAAPAHRAVELAHVDTLPRTLDGKPVSAEMARLRAAAADEGYAQGRAAGWADGHAAGVAAALAAAQPRVEAALRALQTAADALDRADRLSLADIEDDVARLGFHVVEEILGRELELAEAPVRDALRHALRFVPDRGAIVVRCHPDDLATLQTLDAPAPGRMIELVADPSVESGGCVVEVGPCTVDAQIGPAVERVRSVLLSSRPRRRPV